MKNLILITVVLFTLTFVGCKPDDTIIVEPQDEVSEMTMTINHRMGNNNLDFSSEFTLPSNEVVTFRRLAYILSDFYLVKNDDTKIQLSEQYALVDAKKGESFTLTDIPMGDYKAIGLSIGLDSMINHGNPNSYSTDHALSPINNSLHWSWENGYIFTALEGKTKADNESFIFHLAGFKNKTEFELPISFSKQYNALQATFEYDVNEVFKNPEVYSIATDGASTHSTTDPVTIKLFANMKDVFSVTSINE
ncbi:MAG: hypothetical protein COA58_12525 [Bacteroidetes bacterium]|nr:MAG: hypothetical protein COA58_12525 [Bacteroidota bacterium]